MIVTIQKRMKENKKIPWLMPPFKTIEQLNNLPEVTIEWYLAENFGEGEYLVVLRHSRTTETFWHGFISLHGWQQLKPEYREGTW